MFRSHLAKRLLHEGHDVRALDNFATGRRENLLEFVDEIELVEGDRESPPPVTGTFIGPTLGQVSKDRR